MTDNKDFVTILQKNGGTFKLYEPRQIGQEYIAGRIGGRLTEIKLSNIDKIIDGRMGGSN